MAYDKSKWHEQGEFPEELPAANAGTHIGLFLAWCFQQGWTGALHLQNEPEAVQAVIAGRMTGREFLEQFCDGCFNEEDLNEAGNAFAQDYYASDEYEADYAQAFVSKRRPTIYHVNDDPKAYARISKVLDKRYRQWQRAQKKRSPDEIALAASGTAKGILDLKTGELIFREPEFRLGPQTSQEAFLESAVGQRLEVLVDNPPYVSWVIRATPKLGGVPMTVAVYFNGDKPHLLSLTVVDEQPPETPWDPQYQAERKRINSTWVERVFGTAREFSWGSLQISTRSGSDGIFFKYPL